MRDEKTRIDDLPNSARIRNRITFDTTRTLIKYRDP